MRGPRPAIYPYSLNSGEVEFSEVGRVPQHCYGAYDPSPVVSSRTCLASFTNEAGTSTSLGPADRKSGASKPGARWISDGMPASFSTPSISSATDSSGAAATFTHLSTTGAPRSATAGCTLRAPSSHRTSARRGGSSRAAGRRTRGLWIESSYSVPPTLAFALHRGQDATLSLCLTACFRLA